MTRVKVGDLAVPMVRRPCPHDDCLACTAGRQDFCFTGDYSERGIKERHGFMTEWVVDDERWMNVVPRSLRDVGVLVEPLTIAEKALAQVRHIQQRLPWACPASGGKHHGGCHRAVVLGAGPVGLLGAMALVADGFDTYVYSRGGADSPRARLAAEIGATFVPAETVARRRAAEEGRRDRPRLRGDGRVVARLRRARGARHERHLRPHRRSGPARADAGRHRSADAEPGAAEPGRRSAR